MQPCHLLKIHKKSSHSTEHAHFLIAPSGCRLGQVALLQSFMATSRAVGRSAGDFCKQSITIYSSAGSTGNSLI